MSTNDKVTIKLNITERIGWSPSQGLQETKYGIEKEFDSSVLDNIPTKPLCIKNKSIWYATLNDRIVVNYKGKTTYTTERLLYNGVYCTFKNNLRSYELGLDNIGSSVEIDIEDLINRLLDTGILKFIEV